MDKALSDLKLQVKQYADMADHDKIMGNVYGEIMEEREACAYTLNEYKIRFLNINKNNIDEECDDIMFGDIMNKINIIKINMSQELDMNALLEMYENLNKYKTLLKTYFDNKKMEIIPI